MPIDRLIHRYPDRVVILVTDFCATYCRHCFRRNFTGHRHGFISEVLQRRVAAYLADHPVVSEVLLSGGDPLTADDAPLVDLVARIRAARPDIVIRIGTRVPVVMPMRVTDALVAALRPYAPIWIATQFNHPRELTPESLAAAAGLTDNGIPILNQAVLLRGVNDDPAILAELMRGLVKARIKPYYLFQGDLAQGTSHLRVPLEEGMRIVKALRRMVSGLAMPVYAVDLPDGGGKVPLTESYRKRCEGKWMVFENREGDEYRYPL